MTRKRQPSIYFFFKALYTKFYKNYCPETPNPIAVDIFFDTAIKVHIPKKKDKARFSTKIALTANEIKPSINVPLVFVFCIHGLQPEIFSMFLHPK